MKLNRKDFLAKIHQQSWWNVIQKGDFLLNQIVTHQLNKKWANIRNTEKLYKFLQDHSVFETVLLNYIDKKPDDLTLVLYREPITKKFLAFDIGETEKIEENVKGDARRDPFQMWWYKKVHINLSKGKLLTVAISEKLGYLNADFRSSNIKTEQFKLLKLFTKQALIKYDSDEDVDEIGDALAELLPLLQEIDQADSWEE